MLGGAGCRVDCAAVMPTTVVGWLLQVGRLKAGSLRDPLEHDGPDLFVIMEREDEIRPSLAGERPVRT